MVNHSAKIGLVLFIAAVSTPCTAAAQHSSEGALTNGAKWKFTVPANWNGTLLLWSHGYQPVLRPAEDGPANHRDALLAAGYALAGSSFSKGGWALAEAVPDQLETLQAFTAQHGKPKRVIAWGYSMGGLVTTALAERPATPIDGGVAMCASIGGAVGMMNMALDGAYAFKTLLAPQSAIQLVNITDDRANGRRVNEVLGAANTTAAGRARVALASVLAGIPGWTSPNLPEPSPKDYAAQQAEMARSFDMGVFLPRTDQEARAGGAFSWNIGVDYKRQLALSGRKKMVEALYREAGLSLSDDLAKLNAGERTSAKPVAVEYMTRHYTPNGRPLVPLVSVQMIGDGLTSPSLQRGYAEAVAGNGKSKQLANLWVAGAGHCNFATPTVLSALHHVEARIETQKWPSLPAGFVKHVPAPMQRPCVRDGKCR